MLSSLTSNRETSPWNDSKDDSSIALPEPIMCNCQNQLGHWDWNGVPHEDLPELCKWSVGAYLENGLTSPKNGKREVSNSLCGELTYLQDEVSISRTGDVNENSSATESDPEWENGKTNQICDVQKLKALVVTTRQTGLKHSVRNASGNLKDTNIANAKKDIVVGGDGPTGTRGRKRKQLSNEIPGTWTCKKSKVSVHMTNLTQS